MIGKNNPFNIRSVGHNFWLGSIGSTRGFCDFLSLDLGVRAACIIVMRSYRKKGVLSVSEIINRFAPSDENDTSAYISYVCSIVGCFPFDVPSREEFPLLLYAMSKFEGNPVSVSTITSVIKEYNIVPYKFKK